jgi:hypothetical protein
MILWGKVAGSFPFNSIDTYAQKISFSFQYQGYISTLIIAVYKETLCSRYTGEKSTDLCSVLSHVCCLDALFPYYLAGASLPFSFSRQISLSVCATNNSHPVLKPRGRLPTSHR